MDDRAKRLKIELPIFALILAYLLLLLYETLQLRPDPRLVPLVILVPGIVITVAHMVNLARPGVLPSLTVASDVLDVDRSDEASVVDDPRSGIVDSLLIVAWFGLLVGLVFLFGFVIATVVFSSLFLYTVGDQPWQRSLIIAVVLAVGLDLIFIELINVRPLDPFVPLGLP